MTQDYVARQMVDEMREIGNHLGDLVEAIKEQVSASLTEIKIPESFEGREAPANSMQEVLKGMRPKEPEDLASWAMSKIHESDSLPQWEKDLLEGKDAPTFEQELVWLLNKHGMEKYSNTPDWVLARYVMQSLRAFDLSLLMREGDQTVQMMRENKESKNAEA